MYNANSRAITKLFLKVSIIDMLMEKRKWSHIQFSIKIREGRKLIEERKKEQKSMNRKQ